MSSRNLEILLHETSCSYFSLQQVRGTVRLNTDRPIVVKSLKLLVHGHSLVIIEDSNSNNKSERKINHVDQEHSLTSTSSEKIVQSSGSHDYSFEFNIGAYWPTSVELENGYVRYWLEAILIHVNSIQESTKIGFTVNKIVDINDLPITFKKRSEKEVKTAQIHLKACVERTAYVPGETIVFNGLIKTLGGNTIQRSSLTFIQVATLCSSRNRCTKSWAIFKLTRTASVSVDEWNGIKITIPPVVPTTANSIIDIQYFIKLEAGLCLSIPILIGNVPLLKTFANFQPPDDVDVSLIGKVQPVSNGYSIVVPNVFEEAVGKEFVFIARNSSQILKKLGTEFWPRYACYKEI